MTKEWDGVTLARAVNYDMASRLLAMINQEAAQAADNNLQSDLVHLEDTYGALLNGIYGFKLVNTNVAKRNFPGIDLIDEEALLCVQVTADTSPAKMRETLKKPVMEQLANKGYTLKFCYAGEQNKNAKRRNPPNPYGINFKAADDVILTSDILGAFNHFDLDRQEETLDILRRETEEGFVLREGWMEENLSRVIKLLGPRYTPEANVETPDMARFAALSGGREFFEKALKVAGSTSDALKRLKTFTPDRFPADTDTAFAEGFELLSEALSSTPRVTCSRSDSEQWLVRLDEAVSVCLSYCGSRQYFGTGGGEAANAFRDFFYHLRKMEEFFLSSGVAYLRVKRVLVCGEAGIGKSHLLADLCTRELRKGNAAVMLLGSQFYGGRSSEEDIPSVLGLPGTLDGLLAELQRYARARDGVAFLVIDALNEGNGRSFWRNSLPALFGKIARYPDVKLVVSVRSTYVNEVVPQCLVDGEDFQIMECRGFGEVSSVAVNTMCDYYGIARPLTPLIGMEFSNPLYLSLLCKHAKEHGGCFSANVELGDLVAALLEDINDRLADSQAVGYDRNVPLVDKAVKAVVASSEYSYGSIGYEKASALVTDVVRDYVKVPGCFLGQLVAEGLFNVSDNWGEKNLVFAYELVGNYAAALAIVENAKTLQAADQFGSCVEALKGLLSSEWSWLANDQGALGALSVISPRECHCELYDLGPDCDSSLAVYAFIEGLPWRVIEEVTPSMDRFIRECVLVDEYSIREFFSTSFQLATRRSGINSEYFRDLLMSLEMPKRDYAWSSAIARSGKALTFVDWVWDNGCRLDKENATSISTILSLCLAATNVSLRRKAIKALAGTLINRPSVAGYLWCSFSGIDDDYVLEGLCGALYGAVVNSRHPAEWESVVEAVYSKMIGGGRAYPNAVVRDYVILMRNAALGTAIDGSGLFEPFRSPFQSDWYESLPDNGEIDELFEECKAKYGEKSVEAFSVWWLIHSMTTEYGRGTSCYGDFGRYTLGRRVSVWANWFEGDQLLSNALIKHILTQWYRPELHSVYDAEVKRLEGRAGFGCERIGKKYQKIALNRLVARLADNYPPQHIKKVYKKGYDEHIRESSMLFDEALSSGDWSSLLRCDDEADWAIGENREPLNEIEVGCKSLYLRSHDPSFPWRWSSLGSPYEMDCFYPTVVSLVGDPESWCRDEKEFDAVNAYRTKVLDGSRYYTLAVRKEWKGSSLGKRCREATWVSCALFLGANDIDEVFGRYSSSNRFPSFSGVRFGECFSGVGYRILSALNRSEQFGLEEKVTEACYLYGWEEDRTELDEDVAVPLPCEALVNRFELARRGPLRWETEGSDTVAFCLIDQKAGSWALLFDADRLDSYLAETDQALMWDDYFEKQTARFIYRKWANAMLAAEGCRVIDADEPYCAEKDRGLWMGDDWIDA